MKKFYTLMVFALSIGFAFSQQLPQVTQATGAQVSFAQTNQTKAPGDSCGMYFNNYAGLGKLTGAEYAYLRKGNLGEDYWYGGVAMRYHAPQPIDIYGAEFYAFDADTDVDSIMTIVILNEYSAGNDSLGAELARDTVYVVHQAYNNTLPLISVQAYFDAPVTVTADYMVTVENATDDSLVVIMNSAAAHDGAAEGLLFYYYNFLAGPPSYQGFWNAYALSAAFLDNDALISPLVKYDLHDDFTVLDDTICPTITNAGCVDNSQLPVFSDPHYNSNSGSPLGSRLWLWGDGYQNSSIEDGCHTYSLPGTFNIEMRDTIHRYNYLSNNCPLSVTQPIYVLDSVDVNFSWMNSNLSVDFTNLSANADSALWDFGGGNTSTDWDPTHVFDSVGTFTVQLTVWNECHTDSIEIDVTTDDVGIDDYDFDFSYYPNPANTEVTIKGLVEGTRVELINILGETISSDYSESQSMMLSTSHLSNGSYFIRVSTDQGQVTKKLLIRH